MTKKKVSKKTKKKTVNKKVKAVNGTPSKDIFSSPINEIGPYKAKRGEAYMSDSQLKYFKMLLTKWKNDLIDEVDRTVVHMKDEAANFPDPNDRATQESEFGLELRTRRDLRKKANLPACSICRRSFRSLCCESANEVRPRHKNKR